MSGDEGTRSTSRKASEPKTTSVDPAELDRILRERAEELSERLVDEAEGEVGGGESYLRFAVGPTHFATHLRRGRRILKALELTRVPGAPRVLPRLAQVDGRIVSIVDLAALFDLEGLAGKEPSYIILLEADGSLLGLGVEVVEGLVSLSEASIDPKAGEHQGRSFVLGTGPDLTVVLDAEELVRALRPGAEG